MAEKDPIQEAEKDPIQEFLKNTGWSRDALLEKLIKLRSEENIEEGNKPILQQINAEPFSDTDDEEEEAHVTNNSIINEIIDDICTVNTRCNSDDVLPTEARETNDNETSEIMEVRVIEVNNEEDDDFEEEYSTKVSSDNFQYLETYPRKSFCQEKSVIGSKRPSETNDFERNSGEIEYVETYPRKRIKVLCLEKEISESESEKQVHHTEIHETESNELTEVPLTKDDNPRCIPFQLQGNKQTDNISREIEGIYEKSAEVENGFNDNTTIPSIVQLQDQIQLTNINHPETMALETSSDSDYKEVSKNENESGDESHEDISDENYFAPSFDNESLTGDETVSLENVENIRNNLKLQLSSLRTRKKEQFLQPQTKIVDSIECNTKLLNIMAKDGGTKKAVGGKISSSKHLMKENHLFLQTNELGFVISDVQGGVEFDEKENTEKNLVIKQPEENSVCSSNNFEKDIDDNQHIVLDQIRKIINKQKCSLKRDDDELKSNSDSYQVHIDSGRKDNKIAPFNGNSQPSFRDKTSEFEKKSPFVSDSLDEFLVGDSKLNISYMVPKCGAEEGLKENILDEGPLLLKKVCKLETLSGEKTQKPQSLKAKTVAQKRKLLEREKKRELKKLEKLKKTNLFPKEQSVELNKKFNRSFVLFDNKKLWVKSKVHDKCIANIGCKNLMKDSSPINTRRKFSLLEGEKKINAGVKYRPGPLCKKSELQITGHDDWETHFKILPEISLEVVPTTGLPFPDHIINRLKIFDGQLDSGQIEFALSVLKTKNKNNLSAPKSFKFPLKYHNEQEKVIVRKRKSNTVYDTESFVNKHENSRDTVAAVIDDLIRYVEIREIAPTLIKDDESQIKDEGKLVEKLSPIIDSNVSIFKKPHKKKTKVEHELLRLNCKLVNVEVEENQTEKNCEKPHCHLGCVCKSLKCENILNYHCQLVQCMFNCTCPKEKDLIYEHSLTLPAGTDLLSSHTVNRIEDEAKKNLAKEEREFTQTVIHTKNETIVVGLGRRSKLRRNTKTPAKYSDFVDSGSDTFFTQIPDNDFSRKCTVSLPRLNLSQIIPYCLMHNLYDCYCEGKSPFIPYKSMKGNIISEQRCDDLKVHGKFTGRIDDEEQNKIESIKELCKHTRKLNFKKHRRGGREESESNDNYAEKRSEKLSKLFNEVEDFKPNDDSHNTSDSISSHVGTNISSNSKRPMRIKRKKKYDKNYIEYSDEILHEVELDDCARTRGLPSEYPKTKTVGVNEQKNDFSYNIKESDIYKAKIQYMDKDLKIFEADILKKKLIEQCMGNILFDKVKSKRKQTLSERRENSTSTSTSLALFNENGALQRRNKFSSFPPGEVKVKPVFDGEIIVDKKNLELLKKIGPKTVQDGYARLIPWKVLIKSFETGKINIWSIVNRPSRLLINKSNKKAPKNYVNIKTLERTMSKYITEERTEDVISWILHGRLPDCYPIDSVSFILKEIKNNFEICGVCTRKFNKEDLASREMEDKSVDNSKKKDIFDHRDLNGDYQTLNIFKNNYKLQELVEESTGHLGEMSVDKDKLYMWAALPEIYPVCKWRMIYLNSDFTYLYFVSIDYSIRYTDLVRIGRIARDNKCTVKVTNDPLKSGYDHVEFGIYFDQSYIDRIFIGPYFKQYTGNDVETYRYVNKSLTSTEDFNKMTGKNDYKCGHWLIERPYSRKRYPEKELNISTVDLTSEDDRSNAASKVLNNSKKRTSNEDLPHMVIMHNEEQILILDAPPRKPEDFNLYIISNIPHLGYLGAYKHSSGKIDVSWPFEEKLLRFSNTSVAVDFLQERFSALLQPVPETFKINIITVTQIDFLNTHPIDASVLSGHYICGDFGFENITTMTNDDCLKKLGKSRDDILSMFSKRAKLFLGKRIESLASLLNMGGNSGYDISKILKTATEEIHALMNQEKQNIALKHELLVMKRSRAIQLFGLIKKLPHLQRNIESLKFRSVLNKTEPIEIQDSDEEESRDSQTKNQNLTKTSPSESSNTDVLKAKKQPVLPSPPNPKQNNLVIYSSKASTSANKTKQTSVLKPLVRVPINRDTSLLARGPVDTPLANIIQEQPLIMNPKLKTAQYISGVKLVKSSSGNFVLVPDESPQSTKICSKPALVSGTKVIIQNNKIKSLKRFQSEEVQARKLRKVNGEGLKVVSNKLVACQVMDGDTDLDSLNANDTLLIDLDANNEIDNILIQNDIKSLLKTTSNCYDGTNEKMEIRTSGQYENSDTSEVITIIEDDILSDTEENFQNANLINSQFVNTKNITQTSLEDVSKAIKAENSYHGESAEINNTCSNNSDDDLVFLNE
ncbi:uncharacterized protein isoform X2 [Leptinotarsa decemlineata]